MFKSDEELIREFRDILYSDSPGDVSGLKGNEHAIQAFMENNSRLIPTPDVLSGGLFCNALISKLPLNHREITDFVYVSISSGCVKITLVELENSRRKIFHKNRPDKFHSDFTKAVYQVERWQMYLRDGGNKLKLLSLLRNFLPEGLPLEMVPKIDYMLIVSGALPSGPAYKAELSSYARHRKIKILTYEDVIAALPYSTGTKSILSKSGDGYVVNSLSENHARLLENCTPSTLRIGVGVTKDPKLPQDVKEEVALWQKGEGRRGDPLRVQIMGRHGFCLNAYKAYSLMDVFRRAKNCCEWQNCHNRIYQSFQQFSGRFLHHRYEVDRGPIWGDARSYYESEMRLYCELHYKKAQVDGGVSEMIPHPLLNSENDKDFEMDSLSRPAVLRFIIQHCLPRNLQGVGSSATLSDVKTYKYVTNWLMTVSSMSGFQREIYLPLVYLADMSTRICSVNPYSLLNMYSRGGFSPARYSPALIKDQRLIESAEHEESPELARWNLRVQDENGVLMNEVISMIRQRFTLDQLMSMCDIVDFKAFEDNTGPVVVDLLPIWLES